MPALRPLAFAPLAAAALAACQPGGIEATPPALSDSIDRGAEIAAANCSACHAVGANGASPHPGAPPFGMVAARYPLDFLADTLRRGPNAGHIGMPTFQLDADQIADLKAYLRSLALDGSTDDR